MHNLPFTLMDTDSTTQKQLYTLLGTISADEKLSRINNLCAFGAQMILEDIKRKYPHCTAEELRKLYAFRLWGADFTEKYMNWRPKIESE